MSYAAGRGWRTLGSGLRDIGALLTQREERERDLERQSEADRLAEQDRALQMAEFTQRTGIAPVGARGEMPTNPLAAPPSSKALAVTSVAPITSPVAPAPVLANIGRAAAGPQSGTFVQVGRSAAQREEDAALKEAAVSADVMAAGSPAFAGLSWREQLATAGSPSRASAFNVQQGRLATAAERAAEARKAEVEAAGHLTASYWGSRPRNLGVEATNTIGRTLAARAVAGGGGTGTRKVTPAQALGAVERQYGDAQADLTTARRDDLPEATRFEAARDSLGAVRDSMAASMQGRTISGRAPGAAGILDNEPPTAPPIIVSQRGRPRMTERTGPTTGAAPAVGERANPPAGPNAFSAARRMRELQRQGMTDEQIVATMRREGYDVEP